MDDRYKEFPLHEDNTAEIISADHINAADQQIQDNQKSILKFRNQQFLEKCLFVLENHPVANAMWIDPFETQAKTDLVRSSGFTFSAVENAMSMDPTVTETVIQSLGFTPATGSDVQNVILMVDDKAPANTIISYFISNDGQAFFPIVPNQSTTIRLGTMGNKLMVKARMQRARVIDDAAVIFSWAVLFEDKTYVPYIPDSMPIMGSTPFVAASISHWDLRDVEPDQHHAEKHSHDGFDGSGTVSHKSLTDVGPDDHHPKIHRHSGLPGENDKVDLSSEVKGSLPSKYLPPVLITGLPGTTSIYRDPTHDDRVTRVSAPDGDTFLFYDDLAQVSRVITIMGGYATDEYLDYGNDTAGKWVLLDVRKFVKDAQSAEIQNAIAGSYVNVTTQSAWTIPYNRPLNPAVPPWPTGFAVTMLTPNKPAFTWDPITNPQIAGIMIYFVPGTTLPTRPMYVPYQPIAGEPIWENWTYMVPVPATSFSEPYSLDPGTYRFGIAAISIDGVISEVDAWPGVVTVV